MPPSSSMATAVRASTPASSRARKETITSRARAAQRVADPAHGVDERRAVDVELLAQVADVGLEHAGVAAEVVLPDVLEQLGAREHAARVEHEVAQQAVLGGGEVDRRAVARNLVRILVELDVLEHQPRGLRLREPTAAQDRADARDQLLERERLGHVVVAPEREPADLVLG